MRTNKFLAGLLVASAFPTLYYVWIKTIKNTWIENDILHSQPDILYPDFRRFNKRDPEQQFREALILKPQSISNLLTKFDYNKLMQQTKKEQKGREQNEERAHSHSNKRKAHQNEGKLLLLCTGQGKIVFAHGDSSLLCRKLQELRHKHFFSLGFTQYSLRKLKFSVQGGLLQPPRRRKCFELELVKPQADKVSIFHYYDQQDIFLIKLQFKCSLVRVKLGSEPLSYRPCKVVKEPLNLLDSKHGEHFLTLIEATQAISPFRFVSTFEDFRLTLDLLHQRIEKNKVKLEESQ